MDTLAVMVRIVRVVCVKIKFALLFNVNLTLNVLIMGHSLFIVVHLV
jgi:hypothetical protein